jgi:hypothetical protein
MTLLFESIEIPFSVTVIIGVVSAIIGVAITIIYFRSGLQEKTLTGYKGLYEMEEKHSKALQGELDKTQAELAKKTAECNSVSQEYEGLSQLFAKKSFMLEAITGDLELRVKLVKMIRALDIEQMEEIRQIHLSLDGSNEHKGV